jgi:hypothetical protein
VNRHGIRTLSNAQAILAVLLASATIVRLKPRLAVSPLRPIRCKWRRADIRNYPQPGWVEHDPQTIWRDVLHTAREVIAKSHVQVAAIGIANQRETAVVWKRVLPFGARWRDEPDDTAPGTAPGAPVALVGKSTMISRVVFAALIAVADYAG